MINLLLPSYNRPLSIQNLICLLVDYLPACKYPFVTFHISENNSNSLSNKLPDDMRIHYHSTSCLLSLSQNIANCMKSASPGFFWIIPDDDYINKNELRETIDTMNSSIDYDLLCIPYNTIEKKTQPLTCSQFFIEESLSEFNLPFCLLSTIGFKINTDQAISKLINLFNASENMFAQNFIFSLYPTSPRIKIVESIPITYNNLAKPSFRGSQGILDLIEMLQYLYHLYNYNINIQQVRSLTLRKNVVNTIIHYIKASSVKYSYTFTELYRFIRYGAHHQIVISTIISCLFLTLHFLRITTLLRYVYAKYRFN